MPPSLRHAPWLVIVLLVGIGLWLASGVDVDAVLRGPAGALLSVALMVLAATSAFPAEIIALSNGVVFGPWAGTGLTWGGAMLGAWVAYGLARQGSLGAVHIPPRIHRATGRPLALLTLRLIPLFPFFLINYGCGAARVPFWRFTWTTALGILPLSVLLSGLGAHLLLAPWAVGVLFVLLAVGGWLTWWRHRLGASQAQTGL